ncbi:hypothetical protein OROMI_014637 [Orobanche minor]
MRLAAHIFMVFLSLGCFFLTYNFITLIIHSRESSPRKWAFHEQKSQLLIDPVIRIPGYAKTKNQNILFHVALTATDTPYSKWQCRIMYYWYKNMKDLPGSEMGKLTRILHSGNSDNLMDEIPTFVVDPLPSGFDRGYVVLNRPWAFVQWLEKSTIEEKYILMAEPDHIFLKPLPNLGYEDYPAAYLFFYIKPKEHENIIRKFFPEEMGPVTHIDPIGNSPVIIKNFTASGLTHSGFAGGNCTYMDECLYKNENGSRDGQNIWMGVGNVCVCGGLCSSWSAAYSLGKLHVAAPGKLTYGKTGEWRFDKRTYLDGPPPRNLSLPPPGVPESVS